MKITKLLVLLVCVSSFAQSKVGTIDVDYIISNMPEIPAVQKEVEDYTKSLDADFNKNVEQYNTLVTEYGAGEAGFTEEEKKLKQEKIITMENDLGKFQQNGTKLINIKRDELLRPLYQKIGAALEKVSIAEGYTQVLQIDASIAYLDNNYDVTLKVLKELGIEVKEGE